ncbi:MAG: Dictyostelium (slime mold) repeat protein [Candidatus Hydrogenedentes bacterium ADurb.Bin101]|nr:MAG: Dictyostelium (slime mold) repeat protein [Candidatus Hydrogenedentes bacterium ADurb.Bin101]
MACTIDSCDPITGNCIHTPDNGLCNDDDPCTIDSCDPLSGCVFTPKNCDDAVACTIDSCDPITGNCIYTPDNGLCNDSDPCTIDTCDPLSGCVFTPKNCDDGDPCTEDSCDPQTGECIHTSICEGEGEPPAEGEGEPPVEGEGEPPTEGEGEPPAEGEGEPPVEGEGEPPTEGEGEPPAEGEGEPPVEGEGEPPAEGEGEPPAGLEVTAGQTYFVIPEDNSVSFEVFVSGAQGTLSFQWYRITPDKALTIIPDATDATYTITEVSPGDAGQYQCEVNDDVLSETAMSPIFTLVVGSGVPMADLAGLAAALALTGLGSAWVMRRRRQ